MDTLQAGRADPWYMLDNADLALNAVDAQPWPAVPTVSPMAAAPAQDVGEYAATVVIDRGISADLPAIAPVLVAPRICRA